MGSRDRPHKEVKKKPKDKSTQPKPGAAVRASAAGGGHPEAAQAALGRGVRRGLTRRAGGDRVPLRRVGTMPHRSEDGDDDHRQGHGRPQRRRPTRRVAERGRAVDAAILAIEKQFGRGSIMKLGSAERQAVDSIPTGSHRPRPRARASAASRAAGSPRSSAPSRRARPRVCQHVIAEAQRRGGIAAFIDVEHALDPGYARACGVNVDELLVSQPDTGEQALEITETLDPLRRRGHRRRSTPWRPSCRGRRSRARWATASWASRPGS